ncbi:MAG: VOC family protein [Acidimicrobiales bacterium]|jgi:catechol 2,3-dioxygenase-like lactoylglutathione lyase family enzyme
MSEVDHVELKMTKVNVITLFVDDLERTKAFYREVFQLGVVYEDANSAVLQFENLMINLLASREAPGLIAPARVANVDDGARFQFTVEVDDVDDACAELLARGVTLLNGPQDRPWHIRTASFQDPAGHIWEIAHG